MKKSRREEILDAAEYIVESETVTNLSFDRIVKQTKISKGGVLYHFPSKPDLLRGIVSRAIEKFDEAVNLLVQQKKMEFSKAYILASLDKKWGRIARTLLPVVLSDASLVVFLRDACKKWSKLLSKDMASPSEATKVRLMLDGLLYNQILGVPLPSRAELEELFQALRSG